MKKRKQIFLAAANALCLICLIVGLIVMATLRGTLRSQQAAEQWQGESEMRFSQVSVFLPVGGELTEQKVSTFRSSLETELAEAGVEQPESGRLWADAYSTTGSVSTTGSQGTSTATAIGIGGDFFLFHPLRLLSGRYLSANELMNDLVVIDKTLAWRLYGGTDLEGMRITVNGQECLIAGVVEMEDDFATKHALASDTPLIFLDYSRMSTAGTEEDAAAVEAGISCYEIVMTEPLTGYAKSVVDKGISGDGVLTLENSSRFSGSGIRAVLGDFGERSMRSTAYALPYWENAARYVEDWLALVYVLTMFTLILPFITVIWLCTKLYVLAKREIKRGAKKAGDRLEDRKERKWQKRQQGERRGAAMPPPPPPPLELEPEDEALRLDVESIVREIMEDNARKGPDSEK